MRNIKHAIFMVLFAVANICTVCLGVGPERCLDECEEQRSCGTGEECELSENCVYGGSAYLECLRSLCEQFVMPGNCHSLTLHDLQDLHDTFFLFYDEFGRTPVSTYDPEGKILLISDESGKGAYYETIWNDNGRGKGKAGFGLFVDPTWSGIGQKRNVPGDYLKEMYKKEIENISFDLLEPTFSYLFEKFTISEHNDIIYKNEVTGEDGIFTLSAEEYKNYITLALAIVNNRIPWREPVLPSEIANIETLIDKTVPTEELFRSRILIPPGNIYDISSFSEETKSKTEEIIRNKYSSGIDILYLKQMSIVGLDPLDYSYVEESGITRIYYDIFDAASRGIPEYFDNLRGITTYETYENGDVIVEEVQDRNKAYRDGLLSFQGFSEIIYQDLYLSKLSKVGLETMALSYEEWVAKEDLSRYKGVYYTDETPKKLNEYYQDYFSDIEHYKKASSEDIHYDRMTESEKQVLHEIAENYETYASSYANLYQYSVPRTRDNTEFQLSGKYIFTDIITPFGDFVQQQYDEYNKKMDEINSDKRISFDKFESMFYDESLLKTSK